MRKEVGPMPRDDCGGEGAARQPCCRRRGGGGGALVEPRRREYELTQQGVELAAQWLDALRARRRLDDLLVELLEGGLAELKRNDV